MYKRDHLPGGHVIMLSSAQPAKPTARFRRAIAGAYSSCTAQY